MRASSYEEGKPVLNKFCGHSKVPLLLLMLGSRSIVDWKSEVGAEFPAEDQQAVRVDLLLARAQIA